MFENAVLRLVPSTVNAAVTTNAMNTARNAYSIKSWPCSSIVRASMRDFMAMTSPSPFSTRQQRSRTTRIGRPTFCLGVPVTNETELRTGDLALDVRERRVEARAEHCQRRGHDQRDEHREECVLNQVLALV